MKSKKQRGPKPETVKLEGDWQGAMGNALKKKRPKQGWPKELGKKKKRDPDR